MSERNLMRNAMSWWRGMSQIALGVFLLSAGASHLTVSRQEFQAQVPTWLPLDPDFVVISSGIVEILLGLALITLWPLRKRVGLLVAIFFVAIGLMLDPMILLEYAWPIAVIWSSCRSPKPSGGTRRCARTC